MKRLFLKATMLICGLMIVIAGFGLVVAFIDRQNDFAMREGDFVSLLLANGALLACALTIFISANIKLKSLKDG